MLLVECTSPTFFWAENETHGKPVRTVSSPVGIQIKYFINITASSASLMEYVNINEEYVPKTRKAFKTTANQTLILQQFTKFNTMHQKTK